MTSTTARLDDLDGAQKSAVLCMLLGTDTAAKIMQKLLPEEVEMVTREIATLPTVRPEISESVLIEFREMSLAVDSIAKGGVSYATQILETALGPEKAHAILKRIEDQLANVGLKGLKKAAPDILVTILGGEHPQTIALILAHLDVAQGAGVIDAMDPELAAEVLYRVAQMGKISPEMLDLVEAGLANKADLNLSAAMKMSGGTQAVANFLNITSASVEKALLLSIAERNEEMAEEIKNLMFVFEDLITVDSRSVQRILREVDGKELALALKGASAELKAHITGNMSERAADALEEEIEFMGPVKVKDVEAAQSRVIATTRSLEETGEVSLGGHSAQDDVIQ